ncbi:hypothetical protein [Aeromicrobium sp. 179-A 4D2 NHS]|uniref:hypothetical protein n=1 Tax=Aeromicrobium sp. 179-A 4D2 NHS TaxID=3142375 RepID=UPI0039A02E80
MNAPTTTVSTTPALSERKIRSSRNGDEAVCREADLKIAAIVEDVLAGRRGEKSARAEIAGILCSTTILASVAAQAQATASEREELEGSLRYLMLRKILEANGEKNLNFQMLRGKSACGWFRQFARKASPSELRNVRGANRRFGVPIDTNDMDYQKFVELATPEAVNAPFAANLAQYNSPEDLAAEENASSLIEEYIETARYLRGPRVTFIKADVLRRFFSLPNATRLPSPTDRSYVLDQLESDEKVAYKSASIAFRLRMGELDPEDVKTDRRMIAIWNNHDDESLENLLDRPREVAHTLAVVASMQRPRPNSVALNRFRRLVSVVSELPGWKDVAKTLADAYIATEFNALSSYNEHRLSEDEVAELHAQHELDKAKWGPAVEAAAEFIGAPVGVTEAAIRRTLDHHAMAAGAIEPSGFKSPETKAKRAAKK